MKRKVILIAVLVAAVFLISIDKDISKSSEIDLASVIVQNASAHSEGCKAKVDHSCWSDDGHLYVHCQERVVFCGTCKGALPPPGQGED